MRRVIGAMVATLAIAGGAAMIATGASAQEATPTPSLTVPEELLETPAETPAESPAETPSTTPDTSATDNGRCRGGKIGHVLAGLVEDETITQAQADAIAAAVQERMDASDERSPEAKAAALDAALKDLVSKGTISQAQADAVTSAAETAKASRAAHGAHFSPRAVEPAVEPATTA